MNPFSLQRRACAAGLLLLGGLAAFDPAQAARGYPAELALGYDSNVANSPSDEREAAFSLLSFGLENRWPLSGRLALQTRLQVEGWAFADFEALNRAQGRLSARLVSRRSQAFYAPTLMLDGALAWTEFNSRLRDAADYRLGLQLMEQLTTRLSARLSLGSLWRHADHAVFGTRQHSAGLDLDWTLAPRFALYAAYRYQRGDFATTVARAPAAALMAAEAQARDDAFAGETALRLGGDAQDGTLGFNLALTPQLSLDGFARYVEAESGLGVAYRRRQALLSLLLRY